MPDLTAQRRSRPAPSRRSRELLLVLAADRAAGGLRVNEIAAVADLPRSVVGSSLTELEALGAVRQRGGATALTEHGRTLAEAIEASPERLEGFRRFAPPPADDDAPADEAVLRDVRRLQAVQDTGLSGPGEVLEVGELDRLAAVARRWADVPCAMVTVVTDRDVRVTGVDAAPGLGGLVRRIPVDASPCRDVVVRGAEIAVADAAADPRTTHAQLVREGVIGAYLGVPLVMTAGEVVGALCFVDGRPRDWAEHELGVARTLAPVVQARLRVRALPRRAAV